ncbi:helix-turn-helix transcriptional regulator [Aquabacterium sp.]|uniref:helix-turn-helix transcriptional regulator n=1 Tax=Aquabacterium sp. TaxID=1872578 RepID=UPI004038155B
MPRTTSNSRVAAALPAAASLPPIHAPTLPQVGFLRQAQVLQFIPISKSTLWRRVQTHSFPEPVKLSPRVTAWRVEDIRQWIAAQGQ